MRISQDRENYTILHGIKSFLSLLTLIFPALHPFIPTFCFSSLLTMGDTSESPKAEPTPPSSTFHPAFAVTNIKNSIPMILGQEESHYAAWVEYFKIHICAYNVHDHIIDSTVTHLSNVDVVTWSRLDANVKQSIDGTISKDLAHTIMKSGATANELWTRLEELFYDNKHTYAVYWEEQFSDTHLENFNNASDYCKQLKLLVDQLANIDNTIYEKKMVMQMISVRASMTLLLRSSSNLIICLTLIMAGLNYS